jgi:uncharacterized protein YeaO (DUF488 family)
VEGENMLYTAAVPAVKQTKGEMKLYYVTENHGNDVVVPDPRSLEQYRTGVVTWAGFKVTYLAKLMRPEAEEWMRRVSTEAETKDVVLVSDEEDGEHCYRRLLAEMMLNMFSGQMNLRYKGELTV